MARFEIISKNLLNYVEIGLNNETVRTEAGAMRYWRGNIEMESKLPSVGNFLKSALTGEKVFRPTYTGAGKLVLEPSFHEFFKLELKNEGYVLDRGAYWASDGDIALDMKVNKLLTGIFSGEGLIQTAVKGTGTVIVRAPGPVEVLDLKNEKLVVDGSFAVARSASLDYSVRESTRSLIGLATSGEVLVSVIKGTGRVYLAPIPNYTHMLHELIVDGVYSSLYPLLNKTTK